GADPSAGTLARATTDKAGNFVLVAPHAPRSARIRTEAPWHSPSEQPLPAPSELSIRMTARKRLLLGRLVQWAGREWGPWAGAREPTPSQVAHRAGRSGDLHRSGADRPGEIQAWARAVEATAFGRGQVDERVERSVLALEPDKAARRERSP